MSREHHISEHVTAMQSEPDIKSKPGKVQNTTPPVFQMRQFIGNRAMMRMLRAKFIQAKLTVGQPDDAYEQEADQVAGRVMRMPDPRIQAEPEDKEEELQTSLLSGAITPLIQREEPDKEEELQTSPLAGTITPLIQRQQPVKGQDEDKKRLLQSKAASGTAQTVASDLEENINNLRGGGRPLPGPVRDYFEPRFGYDFSQVRIHTGSQAAETAQAVNAKAFTLGQDMVFNTGQYMPESDEGKQLIAHELAHVIQQNGK